MTALEILQVLTGETDTELLNVYLSLAENVILNRLYPFGIPDGAAVPSCYTTLHARVAEYLYLKRGAEGETVHNENGINRSYESGYVPESLLMEITPFAKVG